MSLKSLYDLVTKFDQLLWCTRQNDSLDWIISYVNRVNAICIMQIMKMKSWRICVIHTKNKEFLTSNLLKNVTILFPAFFCIPIAVICTKFQVSSCNGATGDFFKAKKRKIWPIFPNFRPLNVDPRNRYSYPYKILLRPIYHRNFVKIGLWERHEKLFTHSLTDSLTKRSQVVMGDDATQKVIESEDSGISAAAGLADGGIGNPEKCILSKRSYFWLVHFEYFCIADTTFEKPNTTLGWRGDQKMMGIIWDTL